MEVGMGRRREVDMGQKPGRKSPEGLERVHDNYFLGRAPCPKCPFRKGSLRGWLGPWQLEELLIHIGRGLFPCHLTIKEDDMSTSDPELRGCAGMVIFLNNKLERSRHPINAYHQGLVKNVPQAIKESIFGTAEQFRTHHDRTQVIKDLGTVKE